MSQSEVIRLMKFLKEASRSRTENSRRETSQILAASDSVFKSTSIWVLSMIHSPVFSVWTSTSFSKDQEAELASEEDAKALLELSTELAKRMRWNGSKRNMMEPSITDYLNHISRIIFISTLIFISILISIENR